MPITMTDFADERIYELMKRSKSEEGFLKISLKSGGCSGFSYNFDFTEDPAEGDKVFEFERTKVCIDKKSYLFLNGMEIGYEEGVFKSGIILNNPNAKSSCGCGETISF